MESLFLVANNPKVILKRNERTNLPLDNAHEDKLIYVFDTGIKVQPNYFTHVYSQFCTFQFINLNLKELQAGFTALQSSLSKSISSSSKGRKSLNRIKELTTDIWVPLIEKYLNYANTIVTKIADGQAVMISSGGPEYETDYTLSSLVQIMVDPFYRTMEGFCVLLGKDWVSYGFPFLDETINWAEPVLFHFIHCVWTLLQQNPQEFEFNQEFLAFVLDSFISSQFSTFLHNSEKEALEVGEVQRSLFLYVLHKDHRLVFENPLYSPGTSGKEPRYGNHDIRLWTSYILRNDVSILSHEQHFVNSIESKITDNALTIKHIMYSHYLEAHLVHLIPLTSLDISGQYFYSIPVQIAMLTNLKQLSLDDNQTLKIPPVIPQKLQQLEKFSIKGNELVTLPENFENLTSLTDLDFTNNNLKILPPMSRLTNLTQLSVRQNKLKRLPTEFSSLVMLKNLSLAENHFYYISDRIFPNLSRLEKFSLADNQLIILPDIGMQKHMTKLEVQGNKITDLPDELFPRCLSLIELNLSNNKIQFLPMNIGCLTSHNY